MRFFYVSLFSLILLGLIYVFGTMFLVWLGKTLRRRWDGAWKLMVPLFLLLYIGPIAEELWISWNFGQLCKKDAGILINKTVEVDGYYDSTAGLLKVYDPVLPVTAAHFDKRGYQFYEMSVVDRNEGTTKVAHFEKVNGTWIPTILKKPSARYHYKELASHLPVSHQVKKFERVVLDSEADEIVGRYLNYRRGAPWFFIALDRPTMPCDNTENDTRKYGSVIYHAVLKPLK